jgi:hypothetical protein
MYDGRNRRQRFVLLQFGIYLVFIAIEQEADFRTRRERKRQSGYRNSPAIIATHGINRNYCIAHKVPSLQHEYSPNAALYAHV